MAKIGKAITEFGDALSNTVRKTFNSKVVQDGANKIGEIIGHAPKMAGEAALKVGAKTMETAGNTAEHFRNNKEAYKKIGKAFGKFGGDTLKEGNELVHAAAGAVELMNRAGILETTGGDLSRSMIGVKFTAGAKLGLLPIGLMAGAVGGTKDYMTSREGRNDGRTYRPTPTMQNPYEISQAIAYSQSGRSYDDNAGADDDLVRAISGMR